MVQASSTVSPSIRHAGGASPVDVVASARVRGPNDWVATVRVTGADASTSRTFEVGSCDAAAEAVALAGGLRPGEVLLLENLRFSQGETDNAAEFAAALAGLGDTYVNGYAWIDWNGVAMHVGANLLQSAFTGLCPLESLLRRRAGRRPAVPV